MANACKMTIDTGYTLNNNDIVKGEMILDIINKRENLNNVLGSKYFFDLENEVTPATVKTITVPNSVCGKTSFANCDCVDGNTVEIDINKRISCTKNFSPCSANLRGEDPVKMLARLVRETKTAMRKGYTNHIYEELKANGTAVTADLSTYEKIAEYLDSVYATFNAADYLRNWNPSSDMVESGSVQARYVFLDSTVFSALRKGLGEKCCFSLEAMAEELEAMRYEGMSIISVVGLKDTHGMLAMALYAPYALMVSKCKTEIKTLVDFVQDNPVTNETEVMDKVMGGENFGFKLAAQAAVQYVEATTKIVKP
jgi:hypothetical protein